MAELDKYNNFKRVASKRTDKVLSAIRLLKNCSNKKNYSYTQTDINKIFRAINNELRETRILFAVGKKKSFKL